MTASNPADAPLPAPRPAAVVMAPARLGAMHQTRLSFVRRLLRQWAHERWALTRTHWQLNAQGHGVAIYTLNARKATYCLVVFSNPLADDERSDRVIARRWDVTCALVLGNVDTALLAQLSANVPKQEAGRVNSRVLVLFRANKSMRLFEHVLNALTQGKQPDPARLAQAGYLLRTTAVYGNGKFGLADFERIQQDTDFDISFSAQMCAVYLLRQFCLDWIHHLARHRGGAQATELHRPLQRYLGIGNATGLGMAPYLINHPRVVDCWLTQRERALSVARAQPPSSSTRQRLADLMARAANHLAGVATADDHQRALNQTAAQELTHIAQALPTVSAPTWDQPLQDNRRHSLETQEAFISGLLELYPDQVDPFADAMNADETLTLPAGLRIGDLSALLQQRYAWALAIDFNDPAQQHWFWYASADKEEPRLGIRGIDPGDRQETPLDIARQIHRLAAALATQPDHHSVAEFLLRHPGHRTIARRAWTLGHSLLGDIQSNVLARDALPMHLLRCKLSQFGATRFDPRSDRWVRVTLFQGAPLADEVHDGEWLFPVMP